MENKINNQYATYYKRRPTEELKKITSQEELYHEEARVAALLELQERKEEISEKDREALESFLKKEKLKVVEKQKNKEEAKIEEIELPEYYSPAAILGFSIFFSVIFGGILMFSNLRKAGKKNESFFVLGVSLVIMILSGFVAHFYQMNQWIILLANVSGALILIEYFWKKYLGYQLKFKRKSLTKAILISVGISVLFAIGMIYFFPEQFAEIR